MNIHIYSLYIFERVICMRKASQVVLGAGCGRTRCAIVRSLQRQGQNLKIKTLSKYHKYRFMIMFTLMFCRSYRQKQEIVFVLSPPSFALKASRYVQITCLMEDKGRFPSVHLFTVGFKDSVIRN